MNSRISAVPLGVLLFVLLAFGALVGRMPTALAEEIRCTGTIGATTVDNVLVPDGSSCTLQGTRVEGNVVVGRGATLTASGISVKGSVQAEGATWVTVEA